ncbi:hypothetical protein B7494_g5393 [Chlorociboria aeruginascens]|nr:hypothetical protein B7494_g5393 [Chlorociboria aeruginascens]
MLQHKFEIEHKAGRKETKTSTLVEYEDPKGYPAMAMLVSIPCGVTVKQVLDGTISEKGIVAPMSSKINDPLMAALKKYGIEVGDVDNNLNRADAVLSKANPKDLDLLVLPELAFSGYNFKSLQHISPFLEPTTSGVSSLWARTTALKYNCIVTVGYPEVVDVTLKRPSSLEYYNSAITVNADGETIANYRKSFLYYTDETWALEGPDGFYTGAIEGLGNVAMGICMDLNPYKFEAPWSAWEFSYHILHKQANLVIMSMAWLTREDARSFSRAPKEPDMETLSYWLARLEPVIRAETEGEIIIVLANRTGTEDEAVYAGTSCVLGIQAGEVRVYGILGRGEKELLVVQTDERPKAKLVSEPNSTSSDVPESNELKERDLLSAVTAASSNSDHSSLPSVDTQRTGSRCHTTAATSPTVDQAMNDLMNGNKVSASPKLPFPKSEEEKLRDSLISIFGQDEKKLPKMSEEERSPLLSQVEDNLSKFNRFESQNSTRAQRALDSPNPDEVASSKHQQQPEILQGDEEKSPTRTTVTLPPSSGSNSAGSEPHDYKEMFLKNPLGPRSAHLSPRPNSVIW